MDRRRTWLTGVATLALLASLTAACDYSQVVVVLPSPGVTTTTTTVPSGSGPTLCWPSPHVCGFADATNTGIVGGSVLTQVPGSATSGPGWVYSGGQLVIDGAAHGGFPASSTIGSATTGIQLADSHEVTISCSNCTVTNLKIDGVHGQSNDALTIDPSATNATIDHCDIQGAPVLAQPAASSLRGWSGIHDFGTSTTISHCDIHGFVGGIFTESIRGNAKILNTYVHQMTCYDSVHNSPNCPGQTGGDHCNGWGTEGVTGSSSSILVQDSSFISDNSLCTTAAVSWFNDTGISNNAHMVMNHNFLAGDDEKPWMSNGGDPGYTYFAWTNNVFGATSAATAAFPLRDYAPYFRWPMYPMNASHNYNCGNSFDTPTNPGGSADNAAGNVCPTTLPWAPPAGYIDH